MCGFKFGKHTCNESYKHTLRDYHSETIHGSGVVHLVYGFYPDLVKYGSEPRESVEDDLGCEDCRHQTYACSPEELLSLIEDLKEIYKIWMETR